MGALLIAVLALVFASPLQAQNTDGLGTWVWSQPAWATEEARRELVRFSLRHGIGHLDIHSKIDWEGGVPVLETPAALRELIYLAGENQISTAIVRGAPGMFLLDNHERARKELRAILEFTHTLPQGTLLRGVKYDVEPYGTAEWKSGRRTRETVIRDYLAFLCRAKPLLTEEAPGLSLAADIPYWWDKDEFIVEFEGETKRLHEHVQDMTDFVVIMSYWRSTRKVLESVERERNYAERIGKFIHPALETIRLDKDPNATFWGVPTDEFWKAVTQLQERAGQDPALGGVRIHSYRGLREKFGYPPIERRGPRKSLPISVGEPQASNGNP